MSTQLTPEAHLEGLRAAMLAFIRYGDRAGVDAAVPTCPGWTVRDLVAHQGMVHRWSTSHLRGEPRTEEEAQAWEREGLASPDPLEWLADGAIELVTAAKEAPEDLEALVFLHDAPSPRAFWMRRQCHETTVHAVDAQAAALGRPPRTEEVDWVGAELAADGVDELLAGFLTRRKSRLRVSEPGTLLVSPDDVAQAWTVRLSPEPAVTTRVDDAPEDADWELSGPARELYLRLWNRTPPPVDAVPVAWAEAAAISW